MPGGQAVSDRGADDQTVPEQLETLQGGLLADLSPAARWMMTSYGLEVYDNCAPFNAKLVNSSRQAVEHPWWSWSLVPPV